jgi:hypothetical protein
MENGRNDGKVISSSQPLASVEMGRDEVNVVCTYGKISVWFGRQVPEVVIGQILISISNIDTSAVHEYYMVCDFEKITDYEGCGYVLVSYAKSENGYRATFNVPFSNKTALLCMADSILKELKNKDVTIDVYWTGNDADIMRLSDELHNIDGWRVKQINYKDDV